MKLHWIFFLSLILRFFGSCTVNPVESKNPTHICIASDFLSPKDTVLFESFEQQNKIKVFIFSMHADSIQSYLKSNVYNSKFDVVILKSAFDVHQLSELNLLQPFIGEDKFFHLDSKFIAKDWIVLSIDPYVIVDDIQHKTFEYSNLTYNKKWRKQLDNRDMTVFKTAILEQYGRKNIQRSSSWLQKLDEQSIINRDSTMHIASYSLTKLSKIDRSKQNFIYPNQQIKTGVFYDGISAGIVRHNSKYISAKQFLDFLVIPYNNQVISNKWNTLPIENPLSHSSFAYQNNYPILYRSSPIKLSKQLRNLKRIEYKK